jgi:serpin B
MVPMMRLPAPEALGYGDGEGYQAVDLPYDGNELSMVVLLPDQGTFSAFEESLTQGGWPISFKRCSLRRCALTMPRLRVRVGVQPRDALEGMGMTTAFSPDDFGHDWQRDRSSLR